MSDIINDGQVQHGSRQLTIGAETYETDDFTIDTPSATTIERTNRLAVPTGAVHIKGRLTGSATLQLEDDSQAAPAWGAQFTVTEGTCTITSVGSREGKGAEVKVPITFAVNVTATIAAS